MYSLLCHMHVSHPQGMAMGRRSLCRAALPCGRVGFELHSASSALLDGAGKGWFVVACRAGVRRVQVVCREGERRRLACVILDKDLLGLCSLFQQ